MRFIMNTNKRILFLIILCILNITVLHIWRKNAEGFNHPHLKNDISCHNSPDGSLPYLDEDVIYDDQNIFFVETSCRGFLDHMQACAVESTARANKDWRVNVVFAGPVDNVTLNTEPLVTLRGLGVQLFRIKLSEALKGTVLEKIATDNLLEESLAKVAHASDILRLFLLWKYGGVYMDLDMITLKSISPLAKDFIGREDNTSISTGVIGLSASTLGRKIAMALVEELANSFEVRRHSWSGSGSALLTQLLNRICNTHSVSRMNSERCQGFEVYGPRVFYPLPLSIPLKHFSREPGNLGGAYAVHLWNRFHAIRQAEAPKDSFYYKLAYKYCSGVHSVRNS